MPKDVQTGAVDLSGEQIHWKPSGGLSYGSYLNLEPLLGAQKPLTEVPDEMLFIVIHQVTELWMKLLLQELNIVLHQIQSDELNSAFKLLSRVARIQTSLTLMSKPRGSKSIETSRPIGISTSLRKSSSISSTSASSGVSRT